MFLEHLNKFVHNVQQMEKVNSSSHSKTPTPQECIEAVIDTKNQIEKLID
jgi:hypothetical protein